MLKLHQEHPAELVARAVEQALSYGCIHADGVELYLRQLLHPELPARTLDPGWYAGQTLGDPSWAKVGTQALELTRYDQLLERV